MLWQPAYVGLGSNMDDPNRQIQWAIAKLVGHPDVRSMVCSAIYQSAPMGPQDQPDYLNAVCGFLTSLSARELLAVCHDLEEQRGRQREQHWGPRTLDMDLLIFDRKISDGDGLILPHPGIHERNFVLYPLAEIAPNIDIPGRGRVGHLADTCGKPGLRRYADAGESNS